MVQTLASDSATGTASQRLQSLLRRSSGKNQLEEEQAMKSCLRFLRCVVRVAAAILVLGSVAQASQNGDSIGIAFGREFPQSSFMDPSQVAGVPPVATANWNNASMKTGTLCGLVRDTNGVATCTTTTITWSCNNT